MAYQCSDTNPYLDRHQNLIICSLAHCQPSLKISCKSVQKFLHKAANRQTNNDDYTSSLVEVKKLMSNEDLMQVLVRGGSTEGSRWSKVEKFVKHLFISSQHSYYNLHRLNGKLVPLKTFNETEIVKNF